MMPIAAVRSGGSAMRCCSSRSRTTAKVRRAPCGSLEPRALFPSKALANIQGSSGKRPPNGPVPEAACWCSRRLRRRSYAPLRRRSNRRRTRHSPTKALVLFHRSLRGRPRISNRGGFLDVSRSTWFRRWWRFEAILNVHGRLLVLTLRLPG